MKSYREHTRSMETGDGGGQEDKPREKAKCVIWFIHLFNHHGQPLLLGVRMQIKHRTATPKEL